MRHVPYLCRPFWTLYLQLGTNKTGMAYDRVVIVRVASSAHPYSVRVDTILQIILLRWRRHRPHRVIIRHVITNKLQASLLVAIMQ